MAEGDRKWLRSRVQAEIHDLTGRQVTPVQIHAWLDDAAQEMSGLAGLLEDYYSIPSVAAQIAYPLPEDYVAIIPDSVTYDSALVQPVPVDREQYLLDPSSSATTGTPQYYMVWNNRIRVGDPAPAEADKNIKFRYLRPANPLSSDTELSEVQRRYHAGLIAYAKHMALRSVQTRLVLEDLERRARGLEREIDRCFGDYQRFVAELQEWCWRTGASHEGGIIP